MSYADDIIVGFQYQTDADRFLENLRERLARFGLELHPDKTRRIEFGRFAEENRKRKGENQPETFDFLGFKHISAKNGIGRFTVRRTTIRKRMRAKLRQIKQELRMRMHDPVPFPGTYPMFLKHHQGGSWIVGRATGDGRIALICKRQKSRSKRCTAAQPAPFYSAQYKQSR